MEGLRMSELRFSLFLSYAWAEWVGRCDLAANTRNQEVASD